MLFCWCILDIHRQVAEEAVLSARSDLDQLDHAIALARQAENTLSNASSSSRSKKNNGTASTNSTPASVPELLQKRRVAAAHLRTALASRAQANKAVDAERRTVRAKVLRSATVYLYLRTDLRMITLLYA